MEQFIVVGLGAREHLRARGVRSRHHLRVDRRPELRLRFPRLLHRPHLLLAARREGLGHPPGGRAVPLRDRRRASGCSSTWRSSGSCACRRSSSRSSSPSASRWRSRRSPTSSSARPRSSWRPGLAPQPVDVYTVLRHRGHPRPGDRLRVRARASSCIGALILRFTEAGLSVRAMVDSEAMTSLSGSNPSRDRGRRLDGRDVPGRARRGSWPRRSSASTPASSRCSSRPRSRP